MQDLSGELKRARSDAKKLKEFANKGPMRKKHGKSDHIEALKLRSFGEKKKTNISKKREKPYQTGDMKIRSRGPHGHQKNPSGISLREVTSRSKKNKRNPPAIK